MAKDPRRLWFACLGKNALRLEQCVLRAKQEAFWEASNKITTAGIAPPLWGELGSGFFR